MTNTRTHGLLFDKARRQLFQAHPVLLAAVACLVVPTFTPRGIAQTVAPTLVAAAEPAQLVPLLELPDDPSLATASSSLSRQDTDKQEPQTGQSAKSSKPRSLEERIFGLNASDAERASHMASTTEKYILPGQPAPKLTEGDKIEFGFIHGVSAYGAMGWFVSSGYSHLINTTPNYGTDRGAYGERLGAAALRGYSTEVLKDSVAASVFHQDPRYYKMGPRNNPVVRTAYAVTRVLITRDDDGHLAPNYSLVVGSAVGAALTNAYYPDVNRGFGQTAKTFGSSIYGAAFSFFAAEFLSGGLETLHLKANTH